ncbi:MAG: hypothetical protein QOE61_1860 [Micromonosporaceae bacterium]|nr:hypothetical protein [Micromonosporaceae bacterium]
MSVDGPTTPAPYGSAPHGSAPYGSAPHGSAPYGPAPHGSPSYGSAIAAPEPPPGPGVVPPFVAPPTDGTRQRRWLAVGLAGGAALVLCLGGLFGFGGLLIFGSQMVVQESQTAVTSYLTAIKGRNYDVAYNKMCPAERNQISKGEFEHNLGLQPDISSFAVAQPAVGDQIVVPATINYADGTAQTVQFVVEQDTSTSDFEVCGEVH